MVDVVAQKYIYRYIDMMNSEGINEKSINKLELSLIYIIIILLCLRSITI